MNYGKEMIALPIEVIKNELNRLCSANYSHFMKQDQIYILLIAFYHLITFSFSNLILYKWILSLISWLNWFSFIIWTLLFKLRVTT